MRILEEVSTNVAGIPLNVLYLVRGFCIKISYKFAFLLDPKTRSKCGFLDLRH